MLQNFGRYLHIDSALYYRIFFVDARRRICSQSCHEIKKLTLVDDHVINYCFIDEPCHKRTVHIFPTGVSTVNESMLPTYAEKRVISVWSSAMAFQKYQ